MGTEALGGVISTLQRDTLDVQIYSALRSAIMSGNLTGGERLVQEEIAHRMGTSRIPVRDALKRLVADGLVRVDERGRHFVASFGLEDIFEIYSLRALLEPRAAAAAAYKLDRQALKEVEELVEAMEEAVRKQDADDFVELNRLFHMSIYEAAGQERLLRMIESLWLGRPPRTPIAIPGQMEASATEHRAILKALQRKDADEASRLVEQHINRSRTVFEVHLQAKGSR